MPDSYLLDVGWFFFAAWGLVVAIVSYKAFAPDPATDADHPRKRIHHGQGASR